MKHKHAEIIKAWADGAKIQAKWKDIWLDVDMNNQVWHTHHDYRIKPEPKPDYYQQYWVDEDGIPYMSGVANLRLHFDGETGKLKKSEIL
jgi:hypothetical protein